MNSLICQAIRDRRLVRLHYDGGSRDVEPHCHGFSRDDKELLSGYQRSGFSRSGQRFGWKMFKLDEIRALIISDEAFAGPREGYDPNDVAIATIHCRL